MKYNILAFSLLSIFGFTQAIAATNSATAVAAWTATAKKDTTSSLVVTPLGSLQFDYAKGLKSFNTQRGLFDIAIVGDPTSTNFKLTSQIISNTLTQLDSSGSTLTVGVRYLGNELKKGTSTVLVDSTASSNVGVLSNLLAASKVATPTSVQDDFTFYIKSATSDGTNKASFDALPDGIWSGDVGVQFNATWS